MLTVVHTFGCPGTTALTKPHTVLVFMGCKLQEERNEMHYSTGLPDFKGKINNPNIPSDTPFGILESKV